MPLEGSATASLLEGSGAVAAGTPASGGTSLLLLETGDVLLAEAADRLALEA